MKSQLFLAAATVALALPAVAQAAAVGAYEAENRIVAMVPTMDNGPNPIGGGNAAFIAPKPQYAGVTALIMDYGVFTSGPNVGLAARFICSGSLLRGAQVLTAAHCVSSRADTSQASPTVTAYFYNGASDIRVPFNPASTAIVATSHTIHPLYTGQVIDDNDIAMVTLPYAPDGMPYYKVSSLNDLTGLDFTVVGYGGRSNVGGCGPNPPFSPPSNCAVGGVTAGSTGYLRYGTNTYDYRLGDPLFGTNWATVLGAPYSRIDYSYVSDFDTGLLQNDMSGRVAQASNIGGPAGAVFVDLGTGFTEVSVAGGDSGGPQFVNGRLTSVTSYGLSFGTAWGDCRAALQSSCGEMNGFVPLYIHRDFIARFSPTAVIPEPGTWAMLIAGFGLVGAAVRRRRETAAA